MTLGGQPVNVVNCGSEASRVLSGDSGRVSFRKIDHIKGFPR